MSDTPTAEKIAGHYSAAMDSVNLINALITRQPRFETTENVNQFLIMEEQVIQETPVASSEQPVAETANTVNIDVSAYEQQIQALQQRATEAEEKFQGIKGKLDDVYKKQDEQRRKTLEDQGQWKDLWEEANKTAQTKDQQIAELEQQLADLRLLTRQQR